MKFKKGKLYCLANPLWGNNIYKIGNTGQIISKRLSTIQTSLYLDCEIVYQTKELTCCKYYEKILEKILSPYRINPKREFYYITKSEVHIIFDSFGELNDQLNNEELLLKYIMEINPEYISNKKRTYKSDSSNSSSGKPKKKKGIFIDTSY